MKVETTSPYWGKMRRRKRRWCFVYPTSPGVVGPHRWVNSAPNAYAVWLFCNSSSSKVGQCHQARSGLQKYTYLYRFVPPHWFGYLSISLSFLFLFSKSCLHLNISLHHLCCFSPKQVLSILLWENRSSFSIAGNKMCNPFSTQQPRWSFKIKISSRQSPLFKTFMAFYWS